MNTQWMKSKYIPTSIKNSKKGDVTPFEKIMEFVGDVIV
jgi:hypothetical protein